MISDSGARGLKEEIINTFNFCLKLKILYLCWHNVLETQSLNKPGDGYLYYKDDILKEFNDDDDDDEEDLSQFERLAKMMTDLTADGKVKKRIMKEGIGEVVPSRSHVTGLMVSNYE